MEVINFNDFLYDVDCYEKENYDGIQKDYGVKTQQVEIVFKKIKQRIIKFIRQYDLIVGCVAWLTDMDILKELSKKKEVALLVQKEDFLRPEGAANKTALQRAYNDLKNRDMLFSLFNAPISTHGTSWSDPIRCVGNHNSSKTQIKPRMHNKFLIGIKKIPKEPFLRPTAVLTGSYNFTKSSEYSFENVVILPNRRVAEAYMREFQQIFLFSEPLDWKSEWVEPDVRIGSWQKINNLL